MGLTRSPQAQISDTFGPAPFTYTMAREAGLTHRALHELAQQGRIRRVVKGAYVAGEVVDSLALRVATLRLVIPDEAVVCDRHAAWLHGAEMVLAPGEHLDLRPLSVRRMRGSASLRNTLVVRGERELRVDEVMSLEGLAVTTPLRTCADLGMVRWPSEALAGMNALYRTGLVDKDALVTAASGYRGRRWVTTLRAVAPLVHGGCESPPENILWLRCIEAGVELSPQVELWDRGEFVARFDLADAALRFAVEYDGAEWHSSPDQVAPVPAASRPGSRPRVDRRGAAGRGPVRSDQPGRGPDPGGSPGRARTRRPAGVRSLNDETGPAGSSGQKIRSPDLRRDRSSARASSRMSAASLSERLSFT